MADRSDLPTDPPSAPPTDPASDLPYDIHQLLDAYDTLRIIPPRTATDRGRSVALPTPTGLGINRVITHLQSPWPSHRPSPRRSTPPS